MDKNQIEKLLKIKNDIIESNNFNVVGENFLIEMDIEKLSEELEKIIRQESGAVQRKEIKDLNELNKEKLNQRNG